MKFKMSDSNKSTLLLITLGLLIYAWLTHFTSVNTWIKGIIEPLYPVLAGVCVAYILSPVCVRIEGFLNKKSSKYARLSLKEQRTISLIITYYLALMVVALFAVLVLPQVIQSLSQMYSSMKSYVSSAENLVNNILEKVPKELISDTTADSLQAKVGDFMGTVITNITNYLPSVLNYVISFGSSLVNVVVAFFISIYVLASKEVFLGHSRKICYAVFGKDKAEGLFEITNTADEMFGGFITGKLIDSLIIGILCYIGCLILRLPYPVLIAFIVGVTNIIPFFGPLIGEIVGFVLVVIIDPIKGLITFAFLLALQQLDGNVIGPKILSSSTGLSAFWVMTSILFFGDLFGIIGMFIGVPLFGVIYWQIKRMVNAKLEKRGLPTDSDDYMKGIAKAEFIDD